ncbi:PAN domain-containing protein [Aestuariivirga sp.]|uniref:PAN domain-containing protein n=1 Tax=Aestuariivirga sp. TaxID=2650926 RepID=UPI0039E29965
MAFIGLFAQMLAASAAEIVLRPESTPDLGIIQVSGELQRGDEQKFVSIALNVPKAVVLLDSDGGNLNAGLEIGKAIRLKEYVTWVDNGMRCASACALIWLGGTKRLMSPVAQIGFHAAYNGDDGQVTGAGNALVGAYLGQLGLTQSFIAFATERNPNESLNWLTPDQAKALGLEMEVINNTPASTPVPTVSLPAPATQRPDTSGFGTGGLSRLKRVAGYDIFGFDLPRMPIRNISADDCASACTGNSNCMAFTFNRPNAACFLKASGSMVVGNPNAETGYRAEIEGQLHQSSITVFEKTDLPGADYASLKGVAFVACLQTCEQDGRCMAFTYTSRHSMCWLKSYLPAPVKTRIAISGVKRLSN